MKRTRTIQWSRELVESYNSGLEGLKADNFGLAETHFRKALEISPRDEDSLCGLAETYCYQRRFAEAIPYLLTAEKFEGLSARIADILSRCYKGQKDFTSAKRVTNRYLKHAECADMLRRLGDIHRLQYNFADAVDCYRAVIVLDNYSVGAYFHVHECLMEIGWPLDALEIARKGVRRWPNDIDFHLNLIDALRENGHFKAALKRIDAATEMFGPTVGIALLLSEIYDDMGRYDDAIAVCKNALELEPNNTDTLIQMGIIFDHTGDFESGAAQFRRVIEIDPSNAPAYSNLGVALEGIGELGKARLAYEEAMRLDPLKRKYKSNHRCVMSLITESKHWS